MPHIFSDEKEQKSNDIYARVPRNLNDEFLTVKQESGDIRNAHTVTKLIIAGIKVFKELGKDGFNKYINTPIS